MISIAFSLRVVSFELFNVDIPNLSDKNIEICYDCFYNTTSVESSSKHSLSFFYYRCSIPRDHRQEE